MFIKFEFYREDDTTEFVQIPAKYEVCPCCEGRGTQVNPAIDGHGISAAAFDEDPDFGEAYFSGAYDVRCDECGGERVVMEPDEEACNPGDLEKYREQKRSEYEAARETAMWRRLECGREY